MGQSKLFWECEFRIYLSDSDYNASDQNQSDEDPLSTYANLNRGPRPDSPQEESENSFQNSQTFYESGQAGFINAYLSFEMHTKVRNIHSDIFEKTFEDWTVMESRRFSAFGCETKWVSPGSHGNR